MKTLLIGTISHGTLRNQDLAQAIKDSLLGLDHRESDSIIDELSAIAEGEGRDEEYDSEVINDAIDILQDYAPPYCYVGMHEGDGSDLGVWPDFEVIKDGIYGGYILQISDPSESIPLDTGASHAVFINDHGNVTFYNLQVSAVMQWDCV